MSHKHKQHTYTTSSPCCWQTAAFQCHQSKHAHHIPPRTRQLLSRTPPCTACYKLLSQPDMQQANSAFTSRSQVLQPLDSDRCNTQSFCLPQDRTCPQQFTVTWHHNVCKQHLSVHCKAGALEPHIAAAFEQRTPKQHPLIAYYRCKSSTASTINLGSNAKPCHSTCSQNVSAATPGRLLSSPDIGSAVGGVRSLPNCYT
jgi:hypothetical protein